MRESHDIRLTAGQHSRPADGLCLMEAVALFVGERHSDAPSCACPVLSSFAWGLNDAMPDRWRTDMLLPLVPILVGTRDPTCTGDPFSPTPLERQRAEALVEWCVNSLPNMRVAQGSAEELAEALGEATDNRRWRYARYAARAAAWAVASAAGVALPPSEGDAVAHGALPQRVGEAEGGEALTVWRAAVVAFHAAALLGQPAPALPLPALERANG